MADVISADLLSVLKSVKAKYETAQLSYNAIVSEIVQQYELSAEDSLDLETGIITRKEKE